MNKGIKIKKMSRTTKQRIEREYKVYNYLVGLVKSEKTLPNLSNLAKTFEDVPITSMFDVLKSLDEKNKIVYRKGKILAVNIPSVKSTTGKEIKYVTSNNADKLKEEYSEIYDKAVKDLIADKIKNADILNRDDIVKEIDKIMEITDDLKDRLF